MSNTFDESSSHFEGDILQRFDFVGAPVRGEWLRLKDSWQSVLATHDYPEPLRRVLGEWMLAAALLTATLKLEGSLIVQLQGKGPLSLLVVECTSDLRLRATARWQGSLDNMQLRDMLGSGVCAITLDQGAGRPTWQGIVPVEHDTIAQIIESYMQRSEQLETRLWLASNDQVLSGLLLQKLPDGHGDPAVWERVQHLAATTTAEEMLALDGLTMLHRLFHEEEVRLLASSQPRFSCSCSRERVAGMLQTLGQSEVESIIAEQGEVRSTCEFCNTHYVFDAVDVAGLFRGAGDAAPGSH